MLKSLMMKKKFQQKNNAKAVCRHCEIEFEYWSKPSRPTRQFCSMECARDFYRRKDGTKRKPKPNTETVCFRCGKLFSYYKKGVFYFRKFCSAECQKANRGHNLGPWN